MRNGEKRDLKKIFLNNEKSTELGDRELSNDRIADYCTEVERDIEQSQDSFWKKNRRKTIKLTKNEKHGWAGKPESQIHNKIFGNGNILISLFLDNLFLRNKLCSDESQCSKIR